MGDGQRVVLVKPGDVLLIGGLGNKFAPAALTECCCRLSELTGVPVAVFEEAISIGTAPVEKVKHAHDATQERTAQQG